MKKTIGVAILACAVALAGCATKPAISVNQLKPNQPYWMTTDASARGIELIPRADGKGMYVCSEPSPDTMLQSVAQLTAQVQLQNPQIDAQTQVQFSTSVIELTQRTQMIVYLREIMYRFCEQTLNQQLSSDQIMQLDTMAMQTALKMAEADLAKTQSGTAKILQDPKVQKMWDQLVNGYPPVSTGTSPSSANTPAAPASKTVSNRH